MPTRAGERYQVQDKHGRTRIPTEMGSVIMGVIIVVFGIFWTFLAAGMGAPSFFPLFGLLFIGVGIYQTLNHIGKAGAYAKAEQAYQQKRSQILARLDAQRQPNGESKREI